MSCGFMGVMCDGIGDVFVLVVTFIFLYSYFSPVTRHCVKIACPTFVDLEIIYLHEHARYKVFIKYT